MAPASGVVRIEFWNHHATRSPSCALLAPLLQVFVGPYLRPEERTSFGQHYNNMTDGFLSLPIPLPGTAVWRGMQSRKTIIKLLTRCAADCKKARPPPSALPTSSPVHSATPRPPTPALIPPPTRTQAIAGGKQPSCLLDFWVEHLEGERRESEEKGTPLPEHYHDENIADVIMDFLFASQDASTASLTWIAALMADRPDVLAKARAP